MNKHINIFLSTLTLLFILGCNNNPNRHFELGNWYYEKGLIDEAILEYREVIRLYPNETKLMNREDLELASKAHFNLAIAYSQKGWFEYALKEAEMTLIEPGLLRELERSFLLQQIDFSWKEHLQKISALRDAVGWRAYGQKDPLTEYKQEAYNFFVIMLTRIRHRVVYFVLRSRIIIELNSSTKTSYTNKEVNL